MCVLHLHEKFLKMEQCSMDEPKKQELRQWLIKAKHDIMSAERLLAGDPPLLDTAVYHCQQAAEKALKAFLTLHDLPFQKVHVLSSIIEQCAKIDPSFEELSDIGDILTPYATMFRYPGGVLEPEEADAHEAFRLSRFLFEFVVLRMPSEIQSSC